MAQNTLHNRLRFTFRPQTLGTDIETERLEKAMNAAVPLPDESYRALRENFCVIYACTEDIQFTVQDSDPPWFKAWAAWWAARRELAPADLWQKRLDLPNVAWRQWVRAFSEAQDALADFAQLPGTALPEDVREAIQDPNHPLPLPAGTGGRA